MDKNLSLLFKFAIILVLIQLIISCSKSDSDEIINYWESELDEIPDYFGTSRLEKNIRSSFILWQMPSHTDDVMNSYIIITIDGEIIVIDGGRGCESEYLYNVLTRKCNNHVNAWFISHAHSDHMGALTEILNNSKYENLTIDVIYSSLPSQSDILTYEPSSLNGFVKFKDAIINSGIKLIDLELGEIFEIDSVKIEILGINNPEISTNFMNNSSVVMRVSDSEKSILFTGDLGIEGGIKILNDKNINLKSTHVQMSHHGSYGVNKEFYMAVNPIFCLWPTPLWLWNNNNGKGFNSGAYQTLVVREWMKEMNVDKNYVMANGFCQIF